MYVTLLVPGGPAHFQPSSFTFARPSFSFQGGSGNKIIHPFQESTDKKLNTQQIASTLIRESQLSIKVIDSLAGPTHSRKWVGLAANSNLARCT